MAATRKKAAAPTQKSEEEILEAALARVQGQEDGDKPEPEHVAAPAAKKSGEKTKIVAATAETLPKSKKSAMVAYTPLEAEDPSFTIFFGMKFSANLPREVTNEECIRLARQNPWFKVDGKQGPKRAKPQLREDDGLSARSGLPDGADPEKVEVEASAEDFV